MQVGVAVAQVQRSSSRFANFFFLMVWVKFITMTESSRVINVNDFSRIGNVNFLFRLLYVIKIILACQFFLHISFHEYIDS